MAAKSDINNTNVIFAGLIGTLIVVLLVLARERVVLSQDQSGGCPRRPKRSVARIGKPAGVAAGHFGGQERMIRSTSGIFRSPERCNW